MSILCYTANYSIPQAEYEWRVCFDGNAVILRCKQRKNIKRRYEPRAKPLEPASNSALQGASWEYCYIKHNARRSNTTTFGLSIFSLPLEVAKRRERNE